jgi:V8-like Glu-specific endopeptidase
MPAVGTQISIYGYPGDIKHECLWGSSGPLNGRTQRRLFFKVDACGGMSGSAVYYSDGGKDVIIGVLTIGTRVTNWGVRLTEEFTKTCDALNRVAIRNVARRRFG